MKLAISTVLLLVSVVSVSRVYSLKCYKCDTDLMDVDCNDIKSLPQEECPDTQLVSSSCGYMRVKAENSTERSFRGCIVAGECNLLNQQSELTAKYRMTTCQECTSNLCNNGAIGGSSGGVVVRTLLMAIVVFVFKGQLM